MLTIFDHKYTLGVQIQEKDKAKENKRNTECQHFFKSKMYPKEKINNDYKEKLLSFNSNIEIIIWTRGNEKEEEEKEEGEEKGKGRKEGEGEKREEKGCTTFSLYLIITVVKSFHGFPYLILTLHTRLWQRG